MVSIEDAAAPATEYLAVLAILAAEIFSHRRNLVKASFNVRGRIIRENKCIEMVVVTQTKAEWNIVDISEVAWH